MSITQDQLQFIINSDVEHIVGRLQCDKGMPLDKAFSSVYNSSIYKKLLNIDTGLYLQSADYIYDYLNEEMNHANN
ncbi:MAG: hypothetical protein IJQ14_09580 [Bacteroidales bacterium]|nr:hypothetical protein [Bacteroidales bacterium]